MSWRRFLRRAYWDAERSREIDFYLEAETADNIASGMAPDEAASAARRKFGSPTLIREEIYHMNTVSWLESIVQDVRYGIRLLVKSPGFALVAIVSLALGIGANTAIFQLIDAVRLRNLPVEKPHELAEIKIAGGNQGMGMNDAYGELTRPMWEEIRRDHPSFSNVFSWTKHQDVIGEASNLEVVDALYVTGDAFRTLGVAPWRGRLILPEDEHACPGNTAVVSYAYWQTKLGGREIDSNAKLLIDGQLAQIVGVTPPSFFGLSVGEAFDIALPFCQPKELARNLFDVSVIGRLRPVLKLSQVSARLASMSPGIMAATEITGYDASTIARYRKFRLDAYAASSGVSYLRNAYDSSLWLLLGITGLVLLIACANLANLMLARATTREHEVAVRLALGAGRNRLLRQLLVESGLLAAIGAAAGVGLAQLLSRVLINSLSTESNTVVLPVGTDWRVLSFAAVAAILTCMVFGVVPAFRASRADPVTAMKTSGRGLTAHRDRFSMQRMMVVLQISVSLVLLFSALLFVRSFYKLMTFNPGMREQGITVAFVGFQNSHIPPDQLQEFTRELVEDVRNIPGVENAATTTNTPLLGGSWGHTITIEHIQGGSQFTWVSSGYFDTMGIPLLRGRDFNTRDTGESQRVAVVNEAFVRRFLNGADPLGKTLRTHPEPNYPETIYQIVGVIPDTKYNSLRGDTPPMTFAPASQYPNPRPWTAMMVHSSLAASVAEDSIKRFLKSRHPGVIVQCQAFQTRIRDGLVPERLMAMLSAFFGMLAAVLAMIGLYGVISYLVNRRRNEIGIRIAIGANRGQVVGMVMREAALLLAIGVVVGFVLALGAGRGAGSLLFGLKPYDPLTLVAAALLLALVGAVASFVPALAASKLDAMTALRSE
jgi:predicted permease